MREDCSDLRLYMSDLDIKGVYGRPSFSCVDGVKDACNVKDFDLKDAKLKSLDIIQ